MQSLIISKLEKLKNRYRELKNIFENSIIYSNKKKYFTLFKEYKKLKNIFENYNKLKIIKKEIHSVKNLLKDKEIEEIAKEELKKLYDKKKFLKEQINITLFPKDKKKILGCFLEIRSATGGNEAALFANNLFRMYSRYVEMKSWKMEILNIQINEYGGYKEIITKIIHKDAYKRLRFESGGHRVQRIPETENQGRIHTSSCTVAVIPEIQEVDFPKINTNDLRIDSFRSSGAGGQHVNTTDSAIRITHIPTGLVVECQNERSQHQNKAKALSVLRSRLYIAEKNKRQLKMSYMRKNLLGSGERSDRIRTYNFPQRRITDHRIGLTLYRLEDIMKGNLDILIQPILKKYEKINVIER